MTTLLLVLNTILELAVPAGMLVRPAFFYRRLPVEATPLARLFACALAGLGAISLILLLNPGGGLENGLIILAALHALVAAGQFFVWRGGLGLPFVWPVHALLAIAFLAVVLR